MNKWKLNKWKIKKPSNNLTFFSTETEYLNKLR